MNAQSIDDATNNAICGIRKSSTVPVSHPEEKRAAKEVNLSSADGTHRRFFKSNGGSIKRQTKHNFFCLSLCTRLKKRYSKSEHVYQNSYDQGVEYTDGVDVSESTTDKNVKSSVRAPTADECCHLEHTDDKLTKESTSSDTQSSNAMDVTKKGISKVPGDMPESNSVTLDTSNPRSRNAKETNDVDKGIGPQKGFLWETEKQPISRRRELEQLNTNLTPKDGGCLKSAVEHCERRLERLYGRLIWLKNSDSTMCSASTLSNLRSEFKANTKMPNEDKNQSLEKEDTTSDSHLQVQLKDISKKVHDLKCQIEAFSFLSWIGLFQEPHTNQMSIPGMRAPPANPKLYLTRRPDSDARETAREYKRICEHPISDPVRLDLRRVTFNNWPWNSAWLLRFLRQMFVDLGFVDEFSLPLKRLDLWLCDIYRRYNRVPFHNFKHAFMVTQMCYALTWGAKLTESLAKEDQMTLLVSAICHDLDHPGFNNAYQINAGTELAMRYNDQSPLENHHCATAFDILSHCESNPFEHLDPDTMRRIRDGIIRCILATDMSRHNEIVNQFTTVVLSDLDIAWEIDEDTNLPIWAVDKVKRDLVMMILIKVCDISNEARPLTVATQWIDRLLAEFFYQSDYEKLVGLPVAPFMDRNKVTKPASQCAFIRFVILPLFESLARLLPPIKTLLVQPALEQLSYYTEMQNIVERQKAEETASGPNKQNDDEES
ncbi:Phosphodiesterase [Fasciola hepatica]|uniref:Phosphodiesterase n=1 Tax=Fasciola hepatica TaxID=6192 RepID=A0A4E0RVA2_FASHE|nr:Phosphodiesterase [Fasciola hepatica]